MNKIPKNTPAKARLLDKAQELMQSKGFSATTIDEICQKAGLTKGSFFHYFRSKEDLAKQTLDNFVNIGRKLAEKSGFQKETDPLQRVYSYVDFIIKSAKHPA
ncbi:TetR/AcrR family transcriptional regulator, partial [candidate division KSB1 bacterium]|nr:TetR/AcrR family transcriptional regulator [candidate division KSB1 bacterium]